eukprot:5206420-Amphidinium_carterae.1
MASLGSLAHGRLAQQWPTLLRAQIGLWASQTHIQGISPVRTCLRLNEQRVPSWLEATPLNIWQECFRPVSSLLWPQDIAEPGGRRRSRSRERYREVEREALASVHESRRLTRSVCVCVCSSEGA